MEDSFDSLSSYYMTEISEDCVNSFVRHVLHYNRICIKNTRYSMFDRSLWIIVSNIDFTPRYCDIVKNIILISFAWTVRNTVRTIQVLLFWNLLAILRKNYKQVNHHDSFPWIGGISASSFRKIFIYICINKDSIIIIIWSVIINFCPVTGVQPKISKTLL